MRIAARSTAAAPLPSSRRAAVISVKRGATDVRASVS
jgi:hypothetical protein